MSDLESATKLARLLRKAGTSRADTEKRLDKHYDLTAFETRSILRKYWGAEKKMTTKGWAKQAPKTLSERKKMPKSCFLDKKGLKYPICSKTVRGKQRVSCKGTLAAYQRARQQKKHAVARKAIAAAKRNGCPWAKKH